MTSKHRQYDVIASRLTLFLKGFVPGGYDIGQCPHKKNTRGLEGPEALT